MTRTSHRLCTIVAGALLLTPAGLLCATAAHADVPASDVTFDQGSSFTNWGQGHVTIDGFNGDAIESEGTGPLNIRDYLKFIIKEVTGIDLSNPGDLIEDTIMDNTRGDNSDSSEPSEAIASGDEEPAEEEDPEDPECPDCPDESALPNPDSDTDGPSGPAVFDPSALVAQPTEDGGPVGPLSSSRLSQVTSDGGGPISPVSNAFAGAALAP
jgi:hypothetical protein